MLVADRGQLAFLTKVRREGEVRLVRHPLTAAETAVFLQRSADHLILLHRVLIEQEYERVGQTPPEAPVIERVVNWLGPGVIPIRVAKRPHVGSK